MATRRMTRAAGLATTASTSVATLPRVSPDKLDILALGGAKVDFNIPADATLEQAEDTLRQLATGLNHLARAQERIGWMIGKVLNTIRERRLFKTEGFENITQYIQALSKRVGLSDRTAWSMLGIIDAFPSLTQEDYARFGTSLLLEVKKDTNEREDPKGWRPLLESAAAGSVREYRERRKEVKRQIVVQGGAVAESYTITINKCSAELRDTWQRLLGASNMDAPTFLAEVLAVYESETIEDEAPLAQTA